MTLASTVAGIRDSHNDCCIDHSTHYFEDEDTRLYIRGLPRNLLTALNGTKYQSNHPWEGRLCDRIIIGQSGDNYVCAVEMKGGNSPDMSVAISQIQRGLDLLASLLQNASPQNWYPLLVYSGSMSGRERDLLRNKRVKYRGGTARVDRIDRDSDLLTYLNRQ